MKKSAEDNIRRRLQIDLQLAPLDRSMSITSREKLTNVTKNYFRPQLHFLVVLITKKKEIIAVYMVIVINK